MTSPLSCPQVSSNWQVAATVTAAVSTIINLIVFVVLCYGLMPRIEQIGIEQLRNREVVEENRRIILDNKKDLESHRDTIRRLNDVLDKAIEKAKAAEKAKTEKGSGGRKGD